MPEMMQSQPAYTHVVSTAGMPINPMVRTLRERDAKDKGLFVEFYTEQVHLKFESEKQGRPIYETRPFIRIITPGARDSLIADMTKKSSEVYKKRFEVEWDNFERGNSLAQTGTPIETWPIIGRHKAYELKSLGIHVVEQIPEIPDDVLHNMGIGGREMKEKARDFLKSATAVEDAKRLEAETAQKDAVITELQARLAQLETHTGLESPRNQKAQRA